MQVVGFARASGEERTCQFESVGQLRPHVLHSGRCAAGGVSNRRQQ